MAIDAAESNITAQRKRIDSRSDHIYARSIRPYHPRRDDGEFGLAVARESSLLHIIGVSVKLTSIETKIATVAVMPN